MEKFTYDISYKTLIGSTPVRIRFNKIDEFIRIYDGTRYLIFGSENMIPVKTELDVL